jgi:uncharacterized protein (TIGR02271 family)
MPDHRDQTDDRRRQTGDEEQIQLREEELRVTKQPVETGHARIKTDVVEEEKSVDVPVTREEVFVERHPTEHRPAGGPIGQERTIDVPIREERARVEKEPVVYEEVNVGKRATTETQRVSDTVRREEAYIDHDKDAPVDHQQAGLQHWDQAGERYRSAWEQRNKSTKRKWDDVEPAYRYSHEMSSDPKYRGKKWGQVESDLGTGYSEWSRQRGYSMSADDPWERLRQDVREAWDEVHSESRR